MGELDGSIDVFDEEQHGASDDIRCSLDYAGNEGKSLAENLTMVIRETIEQFIEGLRYIGKHGVDEHIAVLSTDTPCDVERKVRQLELTHYPIAIKQYIKLH